MRFIVDAWRGEKPLHLMVWVYIGVPIAVFILIAVIFQFFPPPQSAFAAKFVTIAFASFALTFVPTYLVWVYVALWRCARNSKPVYRTLAHIYVVLAVLATLANLLAGGIESYQHYQQRAAVEVRLR